MIESRGNLNTIDLLNNIEKKPPPTFADVVTKEELKKAIEANGGWMSYTAKALRIPLRTLEYLVVQKYPELQDVIMEQREMYVDLAEYKIVEKVNQGHFEAVKFYLKCQGKKRGWIERAEVEETSEAPIVINITNASDVNINTPKKDSKEIVKEVEVHEVKETKATFNDLLDNLKKNQ